MTSFLGSAVGSATPKCVIPNGDSSASSHNDAAKIIQKLHQLEVGQKKIIHLLNNLDKELSARESRQRNCCFKHNNGIKSTTTTGSFKTESFSFSHFKRWKISIILKNGWKQRGFYLESHHSFRMTSSLLHFLSTNVALPNFHVRNNICGQ